MVICGKVEKNRIIVEYTCMKIFSLLFKKNKDNLFIFIISFLFSYFFYNIKHKKIMNQKVAWKLEGFSMETVSRKNNAWVLNALHKTLWYILSSDVWSWLEIWACHKSSGRLHVLSPGCLRLPRDRSSSVQNFINSEISPKFSRFIFE